MNILYYIPNLTRSNGGIYQYSMALLNILTKDKSNNYFILNKVQDEEVKSIIKHTSNFQLLPITALREISKWGRLYNKIKRKVYYHIKPLRPLLPLKSNFDALLKKYNIDLVHCPYQDMPACSIPCITTIHDVQELHYPAFFSSAERAHRAVHYKKIIDRSDKVIVSYQHIKDDIVKFFQKSEKDVSVILLNMDQLWIDKYTNSSLAYLPSDLPAKFLFYPAATWEHKNHINLVKAVHRIREQLGIDVHVICTGHKNDHFKKIERLMLELAVDKNFLFLGIVADEQLYSLYQKCHGVVVPTLYEAGSFPLIEGVLLGKAVICSNVTSLPETIGAIDFTFDPNDIEDMASKILKLWKDELFLERNLAHVHKQSKTIRNNQCLEKMVQLYQYVRIGES